RRLVEGDDANLVLAGELRRRSEGGLARQLDLRRSRWALAHTSGGIDHQLDRDARVGGASGYVHRDRERVLERRLAVGADAKAAVAADDDESSAKVTNVGLQGGEAVGSHPGC